MADDTETKHEQLDADYYVQSPDGGIYPVSAQGRSDLVARGYTDITDDGGAEKFAKQNEDEGAAAPSTPASTETGPEASNEASNEAAAKPEPPTRATPAQGRRSGTDTSAGPPSQNPTDTAQS